MSAITTKDGTQIYYLQGLATRAIHRRAVPEAAEGGGAGDVGAWSDAG
jgi:hypothetical protein